MKEDKVEEKNKVLGGSGIKRRRRLLTMKTHTREREIETEVPPYPA